MALADKIRRCARIKMQRTDKLISQPLNKCDRALPYVYICAHPRKIYTKPHRFGYYIYIYIYVREEYAPQVLASISSAMCRSIFTRLYLLVWSYQCVAHGKLLFVLGVYVWTFLLLVVWAEAACAYMYVVCANYAVRFISKCCAVAVYRYL